jgi:hypothetical protein
VCDLACPQRVTVVCRSNDPASIFPVEHPYIRRARVDTMATPSNVKDAAPVQPGQDPVPSYTADQTSDPHAAGEEPSSLSLSSNPRPCLHGLPTELIQQIWLESGNVTLPATCKTIYNALATCTTVQVMFACRLCTASKVSAKLTNRAGHLVALASPDHDEIYARFQQLVYCAWFTIDVLKRAGAASTLEQLDRYWVTEGYEMTQTTKDELKKWRTTLLSSATFTGQGKYTFAGKDRKGNAVSVEIDLGKWEVCLTALGEKRTLKHPLTNLLSSGRYLLSLPRRFVLRGVGEPEIETMEALVTRFNFRIPLDIGRNGQYAEAVTEAIKQNNVRQANALFQSAEHVHAMNWPAADEWEDYLNISRLRPKPSAFVWAARHDNEELMGRLFDFKYRDTLPILNGEVRRWVSKAGERGSQLGKRIAEHIRLAEQINSEEREDGGRIWYTEETEDGFE